jgi:hypothetical protein
MSAASAFRILLQCQRNKMTLNVVEVERRMDIFNEEYIEFLSDSPEIISKIDRTQLIRLSLI